MLNYDKKMIFIIAQNKSWNSIVSELRHGQKLTHWIWYAFPQLKGLSTSEKGILYGIEDLYEAIDYLENDLLYDRFFYLLNIVKKIESNDILKIMGSEIDALKFTSSLTLFEKALPENPIFNELFLKFNLERDIVTINLIKNQKISYYKIKIWLRKKFEFLK